MHYHEYGKVKGEISGIPPIFILYTLYSRQEYWNGLPFPSVGDLPDPGFKPVSPALAGRFFTIEPLEKFPTDYLDCINFFFVLLFRENFYLNTL